MIIRPNICLSRQEGRRVLELETNAIIREENFPEVVIDFLTEVEEQSAEMKLQLAKVFKSGAASIKSPTVI